jgi:hypothetical protein
MLACSGFCLENSRCLSCSFNNITELCVLWDEDFIGVLDTNVVSENGWEYYYIIKGLYMSDLGLNSPGQYFRNIHGDICLGRF